jgi:L,D-transpeptidase ErfK/SrfK
MNLKIGKALSTLFLLAATNAFATIYNVPPPEQALIGEIQHSYVGYGDTITTLAQRYDLGYNALENANPHLNPARGISAGAPVQIPTRHLLPNLPRQGIVINLPEMRMYYFVAGTNQVLTYPIGIGKIGKTIPITKTSITRKTINPTWIPPQDIREFNLQQGIVLPKIMPPGPDNPLGPYAIYMRLPTYLIHSTIFPESIGKRASFGCIRMYESDIKDFFPSIQKGIPVVIINSPVKVGWQNNHLYVEAYHPLEEHGNAFDASLPGMVHTISDASKDQPVLIDWQLVSYIAAERDGIPHDVGMKIPQT